MERFDCEKFAAAYRLLAEVLERDLPSDRPEGHISFALGHLTRRIFVSSPFESPDAILEQVVQALRSGDANRRKQVAARLVEYAAYLENSAEERPPGS